MYYLIDAECTFRDQAAVVKQQKNSRVFDSERMLWGREGL